ncbi:MFS transporter [Streptomyces sp. NPDC048219]|uniref:MFS transporter n=1 Tax=Streptomyces sp. NPDC048219 TaxID=3365517 RepID=UPI003721620F
MTTGDTAPPPRVDGPGVIRKVKRSILPIAFLLYMFSYMDRSTISYAELTMSEDLGISLATYAAAASVFFVVYVLLEIPSNIVMAKVGARAWLSRIAITWGLVTLLTGFIANTTHLYIARVALGIAEAGLFPGLVLYLTYWFLTQDRSRALAGMVFAQPAGLIVGSVSAGLILDHVDWFGLASWRWLFVLQGLPPILLGLWTFFRMADRPATARWLSSAESTWLDGEINADYEARDGAETQRAAHPELQAIKNPRVLHLAVVSFLGGVGTYGMTFFLPQIVAQLDPGYSPTSIGFIGALPYVCAALAMLFVARFADRTGRRRASVIGCLSTAVAGLVLTMVFRDVPVPGLLGLCLFAIGIVSYLPPFFALATEVLSRAQSAVGLAVINSVASCGGFVGPLLIGKVAKEGNTAFGLVVPAVSLTMAIVLMGCLRWRSGTPVSEKSPTPLVAG